MLSIMLKSRSFKIEKLLYLFILLSPLLDASSCLIANYFPNISISPTLIIRPIIPLILLGYIFFKEKRYRLFLILSAILYIAYGGIHLWITNGLFTGISYGTLLEEASYVINYTYNIYLLFIVYYFYSNGRLKDSKRIVFFMLIEYLVIIYFSIITKTSFTTYLEGMGYRSYFLSGNSISTILILLFCTLISRLNDDFISKRVEGLVMFLLLGIYLLFLVGTRTGMLGFILVLMIYIISSVVMYFIKNKKMNKKLIITSLGIIAVIVILIGLVGSETLERRRHISEESLGIIDVNTNANGHTTGDTSIIVWQINHNDIPEDYMSEEVRKSYLEFYEYANKKELDPNSNRQQQLIYHTFLYKNQKNIFLKIFGNGRSVHYGEIILEMELIAIFYNFGLLGFLLYICPFIGIVIYAIRKINKKDVNNDYVMNMFGILLAVGLSFMAGYVFFSSTCVLLISIMICRLFKEG